MKIIVFIGLFISFVSFSQDEKPNFKKFKDGVFYSAYLGPNGESDTIIIRRKDAIQRELILIDGEENLALKLKVIWVKDSKYILRVITNMSNSKKIEPFDIICKIIETGDDYYMVKAWTKGQKKLILRLNTYSEN